MQFTVAAIVLGSAAAFAPVAVPKATTVVNAFESEIGSQAPLNFWDPLGLVAEGDQDKFDRLRYVELKHGRVCMLAVLGQVVTKAGIRLPGDIDFSGTSFESIPTGWSAVEQIPQAGIAQMVAFVGFLELFVMKDSANGAEAGDFPGDFRNGALDFGWDTFSSEEQASKRGIELNNGRAVGGGVCVVATKLLLVSVGFFRLVDLNDGEGSSYFYICSLQKHQSDDMAATYK